MGIGLGGRPNDIATRSANAASLQSCGDALKRGDAAGLPVVQRMHLGNRPGPARQAAMVRKRHALLLSGLQAGRPVAHTRSGMAAGRAVIDGYRWIGLYRGMPKQDAAAILGEILSEADALIRLRLKEQGLELPHLVVGATPDNQIVVRSNGDHEVMRSFGEDLKNVADELEAPPEPGDTTL